MVENLADTMMRFCFTPPSQDEEADEKFHKRLGEALQLLVMAFLEYFYLKCGSWSLFPSNRTRRNVLKLQQGRFKYWLIGREPSPRLSSTGMGCPVVKSCANPLQKVRTTQVLVIRFHGAG